MIGLAVVLQVLATTTPPSGDTTGYWQQRVHYRIAATLDEPSATLHASGTLVYVNNSPDSLRELYFHQYLNAFRLGSKWSAVDEREGRVRFQRLADPDYGFERFTAPVEVRMSGSREWTPITAAYPGAPDSTVVRFRLPRALAPGDSLTVLLRWVARVSTVFRRQGRRGRSYDFAQWFPKVAVYDRGGWQPNALIPAGELYGEFGSYDVTLLVPDDQVIGASGVPVSGDPGWARARRWGTVPRAAAPAMPSDPDTIMVPTGFKAVRWIAENVHHFAWSVSPDYRYEGGVYVRPTGVASTARVPGFDTIAINVLYRPGDESTWGNGQVVQRVASTLRWLETLYGAYAWPQLTSLHRLDGGGTEFPMMVMNGSPSLGLNLHEGGHMYSYGILANNEWRSAWMDEGLTSYQTDWAQGLSAPERVKIPARAAPVKGYRSHAPFPQSFEATQMEQYRLDLIGRAQPIGTLSADFVDFANYNAMVYTRAKTMYGALRDVMGDSVFTAFLRDYYARWALRHVDEPAMRASAERAYGRSLGWFFDQWVHQTGLIDYALESTRSRREGSEWVTSAVVVKRGEYFHPMPVGVLTKSGWTIVRTDPLRSRQHVEIRTADKPSAVRLDPDLVTDDWDRRNDASSLSVFPAAKVVFAWPFLDQVDRNRTVVAVRPEAWYSDPGGLALGVRVRSSYQKWIDKLDYGVAITSRGPVDNPLLPGVSGPPRGDRAKLGRSHFWIVNENPRWLEKRPIVGFRSGLWNLDGTIRVDNVLTMEDSQPASVVKPRVRLTLGLGGTITYDDRWIDPRRWNSQSALAVRGAFSLEPRPGRRVRLAGEAGGAQLLTRVPSEPGLRRSGAFGTWQAEFLSSRANAEDSGHQRIIRMFAGANSHAPLDRSVLVASANANETFENNLVRPRGAPLAPPVHSRGLQTSVSYLVPGGAGLRGYSSLLRVPRIAAVNVEEGVRIRQTLPTSWQPVFWISAFADAGLPFADGTGSAKSALLADAGLALSLRGSLFDRDYRLRFDVPVYVRQTWAPLGPSNQEIAFRLVVSSSEMW